MKKALGRKGSIALVAILAAGCLTGCVAHRNSNHITGEVVLQLHRSDTRALALPSEAVGALVGVAVDLVKAQIEAEAKKLERQYGQVDYRSDFWALQAANGQGTLRQNYDGFTLYRLTKQFSTATNPAMEMVCSFEPSESKRMFIIKPVSFVLRQAKAKVINTAGKIDVTVNIAVDAMWIDAKRVAHQERIAFSSFDITDYDLSDPQPLTDFKGQMAGWFPGVPLSAGPDGKYPWEAGAISRIEEGQFFDGCFKLTVLVTERDASKAKAHLEKAAKFLGDQKSSLVEKAKQATE